MSHLNKQFFLRHSLFEICSIYNAVKDTQWIKDTIGDQGYNYISLPVDRHCVLLLLHSHVRCMSLTPRKLKCCACASSNYYFHLKIATFEEPWTFWCTTHLSKRPSDLKQNGTLEKTQFSSTVFHTLSHGAFRFVASVNFKYH